MHTTVQNVISGSRKNVHLHFVNIVLIDQRGLMVYMDFERINNITIIINL